MMDSFRVGIYLMSTSRLHTCHLCLERVITATCNTQPAGILLVPFLLLSAACLTLLRRASILQWSTNLQRHNESPTLPSPHPNPTLAALAVGQHWRHCGGGHQQAGCAGSGPVAARPFRPAGHCGPPRCTGVLGLILFPACSCFRLSVPPEACLLMACLSQTKGLWATVIFGARKYGWLIILSFSRWPAGNPAPVVDSI